MYTRFRNPASQGRISTGNTMTDVQEERTSLMTTGRIYANIGGIAAVIVWSFYRLRSSDAALMAKYNNGEITREECDQALSRKY